MHASVSSRSKRNTVIQRDNCFSNKRNFTILNVVITDYTTHVWSLTLCLSRRRLFGLVVHTQSPTTHLSFVISSVNYNRL